MNYRILKTFLGRFLHYKKLFLPINIATYNLSRLFPYRDKRLWVFGAIRGEKYDDNSKYLFEYVNKLAINEIRPVWLSKSKDVIAQIRDLGYEAYNVYSLKGCGIALHAGVAFYTHGLHDFGYLPMLGGAKIVCLWHGFSFKRIYNYKYTGFKAKLKNVLDIFFSWTQRDLSMVSSQYVRQQVIEEFNIKDPSSVYITGQPRNDVLMTYGIDKKLGRGELGRGDKKIICFMPTYRSKGQNKDTLKDIVHELISSKELNQFLEEKGYLFVVKLHPSTPEFEIESNDRFRILTYGKVNSNQELLPLIDILVTDYSGVFVDYALLNRPIIFYTPDEEDFIKYSEKLEKESEYVTSLAKAYTPEELVVLLRHPNLEIAKMTNEYFSDSTIEGTSFCENIYKVMLNVLNLK